MVQKHDKTTQVVFFMHHTNEEHPFLMNDQLSEGKKKPNRKLLPPFSIRSNHRINTVSFLNIFLRCFFSFTFKRGRDDTVFCVFLSSFQLLLSEIADVKPRARQLLLMSIVFQCTLLLFHVETYSSPSPFPPPEQFPELSHCLDTYQGAARRKEN